MSETCIHVHGPETYYVEGSGLIAIPHHRVNDIQRLRHEYHESEARRAMMLAWSRKLA
jgi:hypothetical protein